MNWFEFELSTFLWVFIALNVINVIIQTVKSIVTINGSKWSASIINAVAYGIYTIVVVFMNADGLGLFWKAVIIGLTNLVGVFVVKLIEEKSRKDKLWKVEATIDSYLILDLHRILNEGGVPHSWLDIGTTDRVLLNCYCNTKADSELVKELLDSADAKYFVSESKVL
ncbi:MAG: hypothetical protein IJW31_07930 [Lentisphaeria bacterium]|nr:hypothetical protein [Lentisphaeria bacterium]